jgi:hypothetical protein
MPNFASFVSLRESGGKRILERARKGPDGSKTYKGVTLVKVGLGNNRDKNYYPVETLKEAVAEGVFDNLRAFADHPSSVEEEVLPERSIRDMVGIYTNSRFTGNKVVADLTILPSATWLTSTVDALLEMGQEDKIGISINGAGKTTPKQVSLSESGEPEEVNWLESFMALRSADVVTEAGAGGGWARLIESTKGAKREKPMNREQLLAKLKEATAKGDIAQAEDLLNAIKECDMAGAGAKTGKSAEKKTKLRVEEPAEEDGTEVAESADEDDPDAESDEDQDEEEVDHEQELEEAAEKIKAAADGEEEDPEASDDVDPDADDDDIEEARQQNDKQKKYLLRGADAIRAAASRARESGGNLNATVKGPKKGTGNLNTVVKGAPGPSVKIKNATKPGQPGKKLHESELAEMDIQEVLRYIRVLETRLEETDARNKRLSSQLSTRQSADRAKKMLRESAVPEALRPKLLSQLIGKNEEQMANIIEYHEALVSTVLREVASDDSIDELDEIEGMGSPIRESYGGDGYRRGDMGDIFSEVGLPMKEPKE